ncbi:filamentous hemagglutinin [Ruegeria halocynthiae]|uniref:Filamentous hemagglutinin n=1 Tax=Ruegeria halocynthiae TaxID=985054 RepID=A0A1H3DEI9_9RHOB|nr:filamentous hemagglutinin N-terminal domain-containing protein [Ruegeria halocynthiae]SDX64801.1 filamentous hemagglutinin [Ruegeria halocynthiae]
MRRRVFEKVVSSILTLALTIQPALLHAQNIQPVNPSTGPRPHVDQSLNGTAVINISTPNGAGVSHDVYTDFQADDLILNNSATITNTQLGGVIEGNGNLTPGQEANLWIGEVVGGNQTQLNGILEVAGKRMDVVVANEFGITCNGCGFINTGRATLTTGKPQFAGNGALTGFDVRRGTVTIGAGGLNPENRIGLSDTSRVDVIARAAAIYGKMRADQLNVVAGANQVDYNWSYDPETGAVTGITEQAGEGAAPALAVDVAALGGMYANAIRLIATENGVGVRLNGDMASSTNIAQRADGQLTLGAPAGGHTPQIRAGGRVQVRNQGPILLEGAITSESGDLIDIRTSNGDLIFNGQAAGGAIRLESAGMLNISGAIVAREVFAAASTGSSVGLDGNSEVFAQSIDVDALTQLTFDGKAAALEMASLTAGTELVTGASSELVAESVVLNGDDARIEGQVQALEELTIEATDGLVTHTGSSRGQSVTVTGDEIRASDESQIAAVESLSVTAQDQAIIDGNLISGQQADLSVTAGDLDLQGQINARNTNVAVSGQTSLGADALAVGQSVLEFQSGSLNGGLNASHFDQLRAGDGLAVTLDTGGLSVGASEQVEFDGDLLLDFGGDLENRGTIKASGDLQLRSGSDLSNRGGLLKSGDTMQLVARDGTVLNQSGRIEADGGLAIEAETFDNRFDSIVTEPSQSGVEIFAGTPDNKTASRRVSTNPADLELESCYTSSRNNSPTPSSSSWASASARFEIGGLFTDANGNPINGGEGSAGHMLLHALAGCAAAEATDADCAAGAAGGIAQSIFVGTDPALAGLSDYEIQKRAELFGAVAGLLASGGNADNVVAAAAVAQSAALNNYLSHTEAALRSDLVDKLLSEECQSGGCEEDLSKLRELNELDLQRDADFAAACGAGSASAECRSELTKLQDAFESYEGAYRSREVLADGTLGEYLDVASKFGTYRSEAMSKAAREALIEMPMDSAKGVVDLVEISALALTGDETAQQQLKLVASQTWDLIKDPIGTTQNQIKADLEKADRLEAQGKIHEANKLRSKVFISG